MITFKPLLKTLKQKGITADQLLQKGVLTPADLTRIRINYNYTLAFINKLCIELNCTIEDIIQFE